MPHFIKETHMSFQEHFSFPRRPLGSLIRLSGIAATAGTIRRCQMWRKVALVFAAAGLLLGVSAMAEEQSFVFSSIDFPGAESTLASGINAAGDIVGFYQRVGEAPSKGHGFLLRGGTFASIDFPDAAITGARGISPGGDIVGDYTLPGEPRLNHHGYLLTRQGEFFKVDFPGHISTIATRILPDGTILGCLHDTDRMSTMHGIVASRQGFTEFDLPTTMHMGATPDGTKIAGLFTDMTGRGRGYLLDGINFIPFDAVPGATLTAASDINPSGEIVGYYSVLPVAAGKLHGFLVTNDWDFMTIDVPGADSTSAYGINSGGDIVGEYVDTTGKSHGFLARRTRYNQ
jgi:hypothetical protein